MKRAMASLSSWQRVKLAWNLLSNKDPITKEEVEKCKDRDLLEVRVPGLILRMLRFVFNIIAEHDAGDGW